MPETSSKNRNQGKNSSRDRTRDSLTHKRRPLSRFLPEWATNRLFDEKVKRWALLIGVCLFCAFLLAPRSFQVYSLTIGETSHETILSPITFQVIDEAATNKNQAEVLRSVLPVYDLDEEMVDDVQAKIATAFNFMKNYLSAEAENNAKEEEKSKDNKQPSETKSSGSKPFQPMDDNALRSRFETLLGADVSTTSFAALKAAGFNPRVQRDLQSLVVPLLLKGVVLSRELLLRDGKQGILIRSKSKEKLEPLKDVSSLYDLKESMEKINREERDPNEDTALSESIRKIATDLINVNLTFNREKTASLRQEALASVKQVYFQVAKGESILREGEPVNEAHLKKLDGLNKANPAYSRYAIVAGVGLLLILLIRFCLYFSENYLDRSKQATEDLVLFSVLLVGTIIMMKIFVHISTSISASFNNVNPQSSYFAAPIAVSAMLAALMVDPRLAFLFSVLTCLAASLAVEGDVYLFAFFLISCVVGLHGVTKVSDRSAILRAGLVVGLVNMISVLSVKMALGQLQRSQDIYEIGLGFLGGVICGPITFGLTPLLERLGYTTNIRLLEIANLNHPLLKQMSIEAPGTYHHSMLVGNLAEAAAEAIGANPLLARVGALYHDIGKIAKTSKPTYFIENQIRGINPHDRLEPSMSALILVSHVKNGVEKAREYRLGAPIIDIIQQHHGMGLIKFFYYKAVEKADKTRLPIAEEKYRYPGPLPNSKEAALVMLADVTEAACRTLPDPTPARIQKKVQGLIMNLFGEGQLDHSTLTLKDIQAITKSYVRALQGVLHSRIDYPEDSNSQENNDGDHLRLASDRAPGGLERVPEESGTNITRLGLR
ncbi:MAG: HDIG domain-containing protein [Deltaproteobacteria bacterium]|nr:HDIG domain-containing protein [Deltaproteobacteria bacterium]